MSELVELTRGEDAEPPEPTDLARLVQRAVERARLRAPHVRFDVEVTPHVVMGNAAALERAVLNLLDNAVKFGPDDQQVAVTLARLQLASVTRRLQEVKSRVQRLNPVTHKDEYLALAGELFSLEQHARALREQAVGGL